MEDAAFAVPEARHEEIAARPFNNVGIQMIVAQIEHCC